MNIQALSKSVRPVLLFVALAAFSQSDQLSLQHGVYVREPSHCKGEPNAAVLLWDGNGFSGAHSSKCKSRVLNHKGSKFRISTTCSARGDGTPDSSGHVDEFSLTRLSGTRFLVAKQDQPDGTYRWCDSKVTDIAK